jgi:hypothetical protein
MATFAQYAKAQVDRDDSIGYFAKYWDKVSPGKISSVPGIQRHLEQIQADLAGSDDERAKAQVAAAIAGCNLAVKEFHEAEKPNHDARALAKDVPAPGEAQTHIGSIQLTRQPQSPSREGSHRQDRAGAYTGWPEERFNRLEDQIGRLIGLCEALVAQNHELTGLLRPPQPIDWAALWEHAELGAQEARQQ